MATCTAPTVVGLSPVHRARWFVTSKEGLEPHVKRMTYKFDRTPDRTKGIDLSSGGSGLEYADTVGRALATVRDVDTLIVGHSPLRTPAELKEYQQFMTDFVNTVKAAQHARKSVEEATASIDLRAKYKDYTNERYRAAVQAIYDELTSQAK